MSPGQRANPILHAHEIKTNYEIPHPGRWYNSTLCDSTEHRQQHLSCFQRHDMDFGHVKNSASRSLNFWFRLCRLLKAIRIWMCAMRVSLVAVAESMLRVKSSIASDKWQVWCTIKRKRYKLSKPLAIARNTLHNLLRVYDNTRAPSTYYYYLYPATNTLP